MFQNHSPFREPRFNGSGNEAHRQEALEKTLRLFKDSDNEKDREFLAYKIKKLGGQVPELESEPKPKIDWGVSVGGEPEVVTKEKPEPEKTGSIIPILGLGNEVSFEKVENFVGEIIHPGLVPVVGTPEAGKSVFTRSFINAVANGASDFLGQPIHKRLRIALWDLEDPEKTMEWLEQTGLVDRVLIPRDQYGQPLMMGWQDSGAVDFINGIITGGQVDVFILDSTKTFFGEDAYTTRLATKFLRETGNLARQHGVVFMPVEHAPFNRPKEPYGGSLRVGAMHGKLVVCVPYDYADSRRVIEAGKRSMKLTIKVKIHRDGLMRENDYAELFEGYLNEELTIVGQTIYRLKKTTTNEIESETGIHNRQIRRLVKTLEDDGLVRVEKAGKSYVYIPTKLNS